MTLQLSFSDINRRALLEYLGLSQSNLSTSDLEILAYNAGSTPGGGGSTWGSITGTVGDQADLMSLFSGKADKTVTVNGKPISANLTLNLDDLADTATRVAMAPSERTKLSGVASGATANATDANLLNRANHTGTQAISTVTNLQTTLDGKLPTTTFTAYGQIPRIVWNGVAWPTVTAVLATLPGYLSSDPLLWDSSTDLNAPAPSTARDLDHWKRRIQ
jgi:hypothetical protein